MANRTVGQPGLNSGYNQARSVPVAHDKPRINDKRKVRPHGAGTPAMGYRPSGGAQIEPKAPPIGKERMQMRDVPVAHIHEAEMLDEFNNPLARFFQAKRDFIPGDAIGYNVTRQGIDIYLVRDGKTVDHKREDSYESLTQKMDDLNRQYADMKQMRRELSINPERAAKRLAMKFANEKGVRPRKVGQMGQVVPFTPDAGPAAAPAAPAAGGGTAGGGFGSPYNTNVSGQTSPLTHHFSSSGSFSQPYSMGGGRPAEPGAAAARPSSAPTPFPQPKAAAPAEPAASPMAPGGSDGMEIGPAQIAMMYKNAPEYFPPGYLDNMPPYQLQRNWNGFVERKPTKGMMNNYHRYHAQKGAQPAMAAESVREGWPEPTIDCRDEPAHSSKIGGNLRAQHHAPDPGKPDLNREFAQFRDLPVERVEEQAANHMDRFLDGFTRRMGFDPIQENRYSAPVSTNRVPRARHRWM